MKKLRHVMLLLTVVLLVCTLFATCHGLIGNAAKDANHISDASNISDANHISVENILGYLKNTSTNISAFSQVRIEQKYHNDEMKYFVVLQNDFHWVIELYLLNTEKGRIQEMIPTNVSGAEQFFEYDLIEISQGAFIAVYNAAHMGNGNLELIPLNEPDRVRYAIPAIDGHYEQTEQTAVEYGLSNEYGDNIFASAVYLDGKLHADYIDVNHDTYTDMILTGIQRIYESGADDEQILKDEYYIQNVFIYDMGADHFIQDDNLSKKIQVNTLESEIASFLETADYRINTEVFRDIDSSMGKKVEIQYPQITGLKNGALQNSINSLIKESALEPYYEDINVYHDDYKDTKWPVAYTVMYATNDIFSVKFEGYIYTQGSANGTTRKYTVNINLHSGKKITTGELFGDALQEALNHKNFKGVEVSTANTDENVMNELFDERKSEFANSSDNFYFAENKFVIVLHLSDDFWFAADYESLQSAMEQSNAVWKYYFRTREGKELEEEFNMNLSTVFSRREWRGVDESGGDND